MKKFLIILAVLLLTISCSKEDDQNFLEVTIAGTRYREVWQDEEIPAAGNRLLCGSASGNVSFAGEIETTEFLFNALLCNFRSDTAFMRSLPGSYEVNNTNLEGFAEFCNLDLEVKFTDKVPIDDYGVLQSHNRSHNITGIARQTETESEAIYLITGNFTCTFLTSVNKIYTVTGKYRTLVTTLK